MVVIINLQELAAAATEVTPKGPFGYVQGARRTITLRANTSAFDTKHIHGLTRINGQTEFLSIQLAILSLLRP